MSKIPGLPEHLVDKPGVNVMLPPLEWRSQVDRLLTDAAGSIKDDKNHSVTFWVDTEAGVNAAHAVRVKKGDKFELTNIVYVSYNNKWARPLRAGIALQADF